MQQAASYRTKQLTRLVELDAIRGIAVILVLLYHYSTWYHQSLGYSVTKAAFTFWDGKVGVHLFFILSGFVIFLTLNATHTLYEFVVHRFARLYPAYWVGVLVTFTLLMLFPIPGREVTTGQALLNLTMLQKWLSVPAIDGVYWTLAVELTFYFIMSFLFIMRLLKHIDTLASVWLVLIFLANYMDAKMDVSLSGAIKLMLLLDYGSLFIAGIMFFRLQNNDDKNFWHVVLNLVLALVVSCIVFEDYWIWMLGFHALFLAIILGLGKWIIMGPLVFIGNISYSLYLVHQNLGYILINWLEKLGVANSISVLLIPAIGCILLAWVVNILVENPARRAIRRRLL